MSANDLSGTTAIVTGASRGFGRGIAVALHAAGAHVVGIARDRAPLDELRAELGGAFTPVAADAADPVAAGSPHRHLPAARPGTERRCQPAVPPAARAHLGDVQPPWDVDVRHAFHWTREALLRPLPPGSAVVAMSSGAALQGSPLSGGYAGAKATIRFLTSYAADESERAGLGIRFTAVLPQLTPATGLGAAAVAAYAARAGMDVEAFLKDRGPALTPEQAGAAITALIGDPGHDQRAYLLTAAGLRPLS